MTCSLENMKIKEVIDITTGERLGYIDDVQMNLDTSTVNALVIYGRGRLFGLLGKEEDVVIPCAEIEVIGEDVLLIRRKTKNSAAVCTNNRKNIFRSLFG